MAASGLWRRIRINPLFILVAVIYWIVGNGQVMLIGFIAVTLHELSHAVVADLYGLQVTRIEIWPFGGMADIQGLEAEDPYVETMVAMAGPLLNFLWAAVVWAFMALLPIDAHNANLFVTANLAIGALNLLPVAPLDGGRLARLYLARTVGYSAAEIRVREGGLWLARILFAGMLASLAFGGINLGLGVFSVFLYWGAYQSSRHAPYLAVRDLAARLLGFQRRPLWMVDDFAAYSQVQVIEVIRVMRPLKYHRVVVLGPDMHPLGVVYEDALLRALQERGPSCPLGDLL